MLRGFALLGILLINIELMRGPALFRGMNEDVAPLSRADEIVQFLTGWLGAGKFISSFAMLFGIGAAMIARKMWRTGSSPRRLLIRRYMFLLPLGLLHMFLLFPGDILFIYGLTGMILLAFINVRVRTALWWSGGILTVLLILGTGLVTLMAFVPEPPANDPGVEAMTAFLADRTTAAIAAHQTGNYGAVIVANAWEALIVQLSSLILLPWLVALFLIGLAVGKAGVFDNLQQHRGWVRRVMAVTLPLGLVLNLPTGFIGPMALGAGFQTSGSFDLMIVLSTGAQIIGAPILAIGYLSALTLIGLRIGTWRPLTAIGRMALTAYLLQSVLAAVVFAGFGMYDRLSATTALAVVGAIWAILLVLCPIWFTRFDYGPVERLWRSWTYRPAHRAG